MNIKKEETIYKEYKDFCSKRYCSECNYYNEELKEELGGYTNYKDCFESFILDNYYFVSKEEIDK